MPSPAGFPAGEGRKRGGIILIVLRKMNNERFLVNHNQIECIELIPECKIVMMNHDYYIVRETPERVVALIEEYTAKVRDIYREITISDKQNRDWK